jgi:hypothetical protein
MIITQSIINDAYDREYGLYDKENERTFMNLWWWFQLLPLHPPDTLA